MKLLQWEIDDSVKQEEIRIHDLLAKKRAKEQTNPLNRNKSDLRVQLLDTAHASGILRGKMLDIGAGTGWVSMYTLKHKYVDEAWSLESSPVAAHKLIPNSLINLFGENVPAVSVLGSFNIIEKKEYFDCVTAMGALHHSENLLLTLKECATALKPGGWIIANEACTPDDTPNSYFLEGGEKMKDFWGVANIKEKDRSDHFFRRCEWLTASYHAGLEVVFFEVHASSDKISKLSFILKKPRVTPEYIPHTWSQG